LYGKHHYTAHQVFKSQHKATATMHEPTV